ncbi:MAG: HAD family hydrolase [Nitrososphaeraceae archaeon]
MSKKIAFFDFDGTITTKDSLLEFIKFSKGIFTFYFGFFINSPYLVAYKLKIISNQKAKEKVLRFFFKDMALDVFQNFCDEFAKKALPMLIRPKALEEIEKLHKENVDLVIVSASPENWIQHWAEGKGIRIISTQLEISNGKLTGKILGKNCHGDEKVARIKNNYTLSDYEKVFAYGDSEGDKPMIRLASSGYYKPFREN